jgi:hypothetical protein
MEHFQLYSPGGVSPERPVIFLSAGIPFDRKLDAGTPQHARNHAYLRTAQPDRVRDAVSSLVRAALAEDFDFVFGAQPMIASMVLDIVSRFASEMSGTRVYVFQSQFFVGKIPDATLSLAAWQHARGLMTPVIPDAQNPDKDRSLARMRDDMGSFPRLVAGVFVGGMEGFEDEAAIFTSKNQKLPCFAIGSTGSAAAALLKTNGLRFSRGPASESSLATLTSYPLVAEQILDAIADSMQLQPTQRRP